MENIPMCFQGSDIETLGSEAGIEHPAELVERPVVEGEQVQDTAASAGKNFYRKFTSAKLPCMIRILDKCQGNDYY